MNMPIIPYMYKTYDMGRPTKDFMVKFLTQFKLEVHQTFTIQDTLDKMSFTDEWFFISSRYELHKVSKPEAGSSNSTMWKLLTGRYILINKGELFKYGYKGGK